MQNCFSRKQSNIDDMKNKKDKKYFSLLELFRKKICCYNI